MAATAGSPRPALAEGKHAREPDYIPPAAEFPILPRPVVFGAACPPEMREDWTVKSFQVLKTLCKQEKSRVYLAQHKTSGIQVALKAYPKANLSVLERQRARREVDLHTSIAHPNVICLYGAFDNELCVFFVLEYAPGGDLFEHLRTKVTMDEKTAVKQVLNPLVDALCYLHTKHIIHRDIKPENLLLAADGTIKLADFGLGIDASRERPITPAGTLDYMAPEVLKAPPRRCPSLPKPKDAPTPIPYSATVDVWAVGVLTYELLYGHAPFDNRAAGRASRSAHVPLRLPANPPISEAAVSFLQCTLTKKADARPCTRVLSGHPLLTTHAPPPAHAKPTIAPHMRRSKSEPTHSPPPRADAPTPTPSPAHDQERPAASASTPRSVPWTSRPAAVPASPVPKPMKASSSPYASQPPSEPNPTHGAQKPATHVPMSPSRPYAAPTEPRAVPNLGRTDTLGVHHLRVPHPNEGTRVAPRPANEAARASPRLATPAASSEHPLAPLMSSGERGHAALPTPRALLRASSERNLQALRASSERLERPISAVPSAGRASPTPASPSPTDRMHASSERPFTTTPAAPSPTDRMHASSERPFTTTALRGSRDHLRASRDSALSSLRTSRDSTTGALRGSRDSSLASLHASRDGMIARLRLSKEGMPPRARASSHADARGLPLPYQTTASQSTPMERPPHSTLFAPESVHARCTACGAAACVCGQLGAAQAGVATPSPRKVSASDNEGHRYSAAPPTTSLKHAQLAYGARNLASFTSSGATPRMHAETAAARSSPALLPSISRM